LKSTANKVVKSKRRGNQFFHRKFSKEDMQYFADLRSAAHRQEITIDFFEDVLYRYGFGYDESPIQDLYTLELLIDQEDQQGIERFYAENNFVSDDEFEQMSDSESDEGSLSYAWERQKVIYLPPFFDLGVLKRCTRIKNWREKLDQAGYTDVEPYGKDIKVLHQKICWDKSTCKSKCTCPYRATRRAMILIKCTQPEFYKRKISDLSKFNVSFENFEAMQPEGRDPPVFVKSDELLELEKLVVGLKDEMSKMMDKYREMKLEYEASLKTERAQHQALLLEFQQVSKQQRKLQKQIEHQARQQLAQKGKGKKKVTFLEEEATRIIQPRKNTVLAE
jgi:hypothetical protein